jgi:hypothetical protein
MNRGRRLLVELVRRSGRGSRFPVALLAGLVLLAGCSSPTAPVGPKPNRTRFEERLVVLPATQVGGHLIIETRLDRRGVARFLIDTGSSVTLLSPEFATRVGSGPSAYDGPQVRVRGADGRVSALPSVAVRRLELGEARFEDVQALLYDFSTLSAHLGIRIDGILGFPLFRDTVLTLDYPGSRVLLAPVGEPGLIPGSAFSFNALSRVPLIPVQVGDRTLLVLIDSGSDGPFNLNPIGIDPAFASAPRPGATVSTLAGEEVQAVGRLEDSLRIGNYVLPRPIVHLTDQLSSLGGEVLKHFILTFDQTRGRVTFYRDSPEAIESPVRRSAGLAFAKTPAYWRVDSVVPGSPADAAGIQTGELITRINGEPVEQWDLVRFDELTRTAARIEFTFIEGRTEIPRSVDVFALVP